MHHSRSARWPRRRRVLVLAVSPLFAAAVVATPASGNVVVRNIKPGPGSSNVSPAPMTTSSAAGDGLVAYPFIPPINGFQPFVVMGLTDENDNEFYSPKAAEPGSLFRPPPNQN